MREKPKQTKYVLSTTVQKAFKILECIGKNQPIIPVEIQRHVNFNKGDVHRLIATLESIGYVRKISSGYVLSFKMHALGQTVAKESELLQIAKPHMENLSNEIQHNISLLVIEKNRVVRIYQHEYPTDLKVLQEKEVTFPLNCSATGKLFLSFVDQDDLLQLIDEIKLVRKTKYSIADKDKLVEEVSKIRQRGYSTEIKESSEFMHCMAVPIFDEENRLLASLSITSPSFTFPLEDFERFLPKLKETSMKISSELRIEF